MDLYSQLIVITLLLNNFNLKIIVIKFKNRGTLLFWVEFISKLFDRIRKYLNIFKFIICNILPE